MTDTTHTSLHREPAVLARLDIRRSKFRDMVSDGLMPRPVKIGVAALWPAHEIDRMIRAIVAGASDDGLRELVRELHAARTAGRAPVAA